MKRVYFKLNCGYRVAAKVRTIHKEDGGVITIASAKFPSLRHILIKQSNPHFILWYTEDLENSYGREIRGKAFCMPEDEYDEEIGIKLAKERLKARMNEMVNNRLRKIYKDLNAALDNIEFIL